MTEILNFLDSPNFIKAVLYGGIGILFLIGLFGLMKKKNIIKMIICIGIMEMSVNLFLISIVFNITGSAPIITDDLKLNMIDPIPHALVLTAIVIGIAVLALGLSFAIKYFELSNNTNISKMNELRK